MTADNSLPDWAQRMVRDLTAHPAVPGTPHIAAYQEDCRCRECQLNWLVLTYMFLGMEPTDRVLRPAEPREPAP